MNALSYALPVREDVSRETYLKLDQFRTLLIKWQKAINLISKNDIEDIWERHIWNSFQLKNYIQKGGILDIGSGGGFPGIVLAILTNFDVELVESDQRKCLFLEEIKIVLKLSNLTIHNVRIEDFSKSKKFQNITARAFSSLKNLISISAHFLALSGQCLFLKGASYKQELEEALSIYNFEYEVIKNQTNRDKAINRNGVIIKIQGISDELSH